MNEKSEKMLRQLPAVHELVDALEKREVSASPALVTSACRRTVEKERQRLLDGGESVAFEDIRLLAEEELKCSQISSIESVINATGVILHTAIGRACLPDDAVENVARVARGYSVLQWNRETGKRGHRDEHLEELLCELTGAEAATIANNNAGATLLVLSALARGKEVIVSRGQLVEIGGAFRIPDVMKQSGAIMREVGCTNRTHLRDYRDAINENTALILRVHPSNYRIHGFVSSVPLADLVELGAEYNLPVVDDLGAGSLSDLSSYGLPSEPTIMSSIEAGAAVVTSSGDKLIGGPQAGIITGKKEFIEQIRKHPLARALRVGKLTIAALEGALRLFREEPAYIIENHPVYRMFSISAAELREIANESLTKLVLPAECKSEIIETEAYVGSGSLPDKSIPSIGFALRCPDAERLAETLRLGSPAVASRIENGTVKFDLRTVLPDQLDSLAEVINNALQELWA